MKGSLGEICFAASLSAFATVAGLVTRRSKSLDFRIATGGSTTATPPPSAMLAMGVSITRLPLMSKPRPGRGIETAGVIVAGTLDTGTVGLPSVVGAGSTGVEGPGVTSGPEGPSDGKGNPGSSDGKGNPGSSDGKGNPGSSVGKGRIDGRSTPGKGNSVGKGSSVGNGTSVGNGRSSPGKPVGNGSAESKSDSSGRFVGRGKSDGRTKSVGSGRLDSSSDS